MGGSHDYLPGRQLVLLKKKGGNMLSEILKALKETGSPLDLNELSNRLGVEKSALEGALVLLVRQGKLKEVSVGSEECAHCRDRASCTHLMAGNLLGKVYEMADRSQ
jgi:hypothetical protein